MNVAAPAPADDANRHKYDRMCRCQECHQRFRFHFKMFRLERQSRPSGQVDKTETTLRVGQGTARAPGELAAHPAVHLPAQPGNGARVGHAVADDQQRPGLPGALRKAGMSSGSCWPSPSSVKAQTKPCCCAWARPVLSAAPLPRFFACETTCAPADCARTAVSSVEPSSTTSTRGNCRQAVATRAAMLAPSLKQGITTAHVVGSGTHPA